jgi:hypothetical protein
MTRPGEKQHGTGGNPARANPPTTTDGLSELPGTLHLSTLLKGGTVSTR